MAALDRHSGGIPPNRSVGSNPRSRRSSRPASWSHGSRYFESSETTRLNSAHWTWADDQTVNVWLASQLKEIRQRSIYEHRNNPTIQGVVNTHADDIVGQDGPVLQVLSDDDRYNEALESVWREWFASPTTRPTVSGAAMLKLWIRNLWKCGEYIAQIKTDENADGPVKMRLHLRHPRNLESPAEYAGDTNVCMGIRFNDLSQPTRYYLTRSSVSGNTIMLTEYDVVPPDLMIHEFVLDEEDQARGIPWLNSSLTTAADLRDFDDQVQDAARLMADQTSLLYSDHPDAPYWSTPDSMTVERRTVKMAPPGWKPWNAPANQPPVQYPDYRAEKHRDIGRPVGMPLLLVRLDASKHSWASARIDTTSYARSVAGIQSWLSGSTSSTGTLNRLVDAVAAEARFIDRRLRRRPPTVVYHWTHPQVPIPQPEVEEKANAIALEKGTQTLTEILAKRKKTLATHIEERRREVEAFEAAGLPVPPWASGAVSGQTIDNLDEPNADGDSVGSESDAKQEATA